MLHIKSLFVFLVFVEISTFTFGQTVLMEEKVSSSDFKKPTKGPNFRHFSHLYFGYGFFIPDEKEFEVKTKAFTTASLQFGWRYKFKLTNWFAIGTGINYINDVFDIKQNEKKVVPNSITHSNETMRFNNLGSEFYLRFNFGKRGNIVGRFVDIGAYANWSFRSKHVYLDKSDSLFSYQAGSERVTFYNLKYVEKFNYGVKARFGLNRYVITASYRMSELLTNEYRTQNGNYYFPKLVVGFEVGLHK